MQHTICLEEITTHTPCRLQNENKKIGQKTFRLVVSRKNVEGGNFLSAFKFSNNGWLCIISLAFYMKYHICHADYLLCLLNNDGGVYIFVHALFTLVSDLVSPQAN